MMQGYLINYSMLNQIDWLSFVYAASLINICCLGSGPADQRGGHQPRGLGGAVAGDEAVRGHILRHRHRGHRPPPRRG